MGGGGDAVARDGPAIEAACTLTSHPFSSPPSLCPHPLPLALLPLPRSLLVDLAAMEQLAESCGCDIRQALNTLQMWATVPPPGGGGAAGAGGGSVTAVDMATRLATISKDATLRLDAFTATPKLFSEARTLTLDARVELFHVDYDFVPLLVQDNYLRVLDRSAGGAAGGTSAAAAAAMARAAKAADALSESDVYSDYVRSRQAWGLLPSVAVCNVRAATTAAGQLGFCSFPPWLGQNSKRGKRARMLAELCLRIAPHVTGGREALRLDYVDALRTTLFAPLVGRGAVEVRWWGPSGGRV